MNDKIKKKLESLPDKPGVYIMYDEKKNVIYVGKAKILKNRVRQYFHASQDYIKTIKLVEHIDDLDYFITDTEVEALILESNLIKRYRPYYNILLKDDKSYPYIMLTLNEEYPRLVFTRDRKVKGARYFGPFVSAYNARKTIEAINRFYPMKMCAKNVSFGHPVGRVCLNYHIGLCSGVCRGDIPAEEYSKNVNEAKSILSGNYRRLVKRLEEEMEKSAESLNFEAAANYRNLAQSVRGLFEKQKINAAGNDNHDIISAAAEGKYAAVQIFKVRSGNIVSANISDIIKRSDESAADITASFIKQYYTGAEIFIPSEIYINDEFEDMSLYEDMLSSLKGSKVAIKVPKKADKKKLCILAEKNARMHIQIRLGKDRYAAEHMKNALEEIAMLSGFEGSAHRIEVYDISHTGGSDGVGAMSVFVEGKLARNQARKFKIKYSPKGDDYAALSEVVFRRLERAKREIENEEENPRFLPLPDIIFLDGGINHINIVKKIVDEYNLGIVTAGLVKDRRHHLRALVNSNGEEFDVNTLNYSKRLLNEMSETVHKSAVGYHRKSRSKSMLLSNLTQIRGVGEKTAVALLDAFGSEEELKKADIDRLLTVKGLSTSTAQNIVEYFAEADANN